MHTLGASSNVLAANGVRSKPEAAGAIALSMTRHRCKNALPVSGPLRERSRRDAVDDMPLHEAPRQGANLLAGGLARAAMEPPRRAIEIAATRRL
jgi:hypothetical protein